MGICGRRNKGVIGREAGIAGLLLLVWIVSQGWRE